MAVTFQTASSKFNSASASTVVITAPTGITVGDLLYAFIDDSGNTHTDITPPTGWSNASNFDVDHVLTSDSQIAYFKKADAGDAGAASFTFTSAAVGANSGILLRYSGQDATTPRDVTSVTNGANSNNPTITGITTVTDQAVVLWSASDSGGDLPGKPSNCTARSSGNGATSGQSVADRSISPAGATGTEAMSTNFAAADDWDVIMAALRPSTSSATDTSGRVQGAARLRRKAPVRYRRFTPLRYGDRGASSGTLFTQTLSVNETTLPSLNNQIGKLLSLVETTGPALLKQTGKALTVLETTAVSLLKSVGKLLSLTETTLPVLRAAAGRAVALMLIETTVPALTKQVGKVLSILETTVPVLTKLVGKVLNVAETTLPTLVASKVKVVVLTVLETTVPTLTRTVGKVLSIVETTIPVITRLVGKSLTALESTAPTVTKLVGKTVAAVTATLPALAASKVKAIVLSLVETTVPTISRSIGKSIALTETTVPSVTKAISKTLRVTVSGLLTLIAGMVVNIFPGTVSATDSIAGSVSADDGLASTVE